MRKRSVYNRHSLFALLMVYFFVSCSKEEPFFVLSRDPEIIVASSQHLAFPDITWHNQFWYVAYRVSDSHVGGTYSLIKVMRSRDFINWEEINSFWHQGFDLRDPKFSFNDKTDSLFIHFFAVGTGPNQINRRENIYVTYDRENSKFYTDKEFKTITMDSRYPDDWLWRPVWENGYMFVGGYRRGNVRFYKYESLNKTPVVFARLDGKSASESTLRFYNRNLFSIIRTESNSFFGVLTDAHDSFFTSYSYFSGLPFTWADLPLEKLGGPNMVISDNVVYLGGRVNSKTSIFRYFWQSETLEPLMDLVSFGDDNSYPGFYLKDNTIYGVYYTQTEDLSGFVIRSFIIPVEGVNED